MSRNRSLRRALLAAATLGLAGLPAVAGATDGNLYHFGPSVWAVSPPFGASWEGPAMKVQAGAATPGVGNMWEMNWGCPVGGSEIAQVRFGGLRTAVPSSLEVRVTGNRHVLWAVSDASLPQSPAGGRFYGVDLPPGHCNVHLALTQVESRAQHKRTYFIDGPGVLVRDVTPPNAAWTHLSGGWFNAIERPLDVRWSVNDNFGADGVGLQQVIVGGRALWAGHPGVGDHRLDLGLGAVGDGIHGVEVRVDGDGTGGASIGGAVHIDRTAPTLNTTAPGHPGTPRRVDLGWEAHDATSGVAAGRVEIAHSGGWLGLTDFAGAGKHARQATVPEQVPDGSHAWRAVAGDNAGNTRVTTGAGAVIVDTTAPTVAVHASPAGWVRAADIDATLGDNLERLLGLGVAEVHVNAATDGRATGEWKRVRNAPATPGRTVIPVPLEGVADGVHLVRITLRNGGSFGAHLAGTATVTLRVDRTPPVVPAARFASAGGGLLRADWTAEDATSGMARMAVQWRDGAHWRTLGEHTVGQGAGHMAVDAAALGVGERQLRVLATDAAGNSAAREGTAVIATAKAASTLPSTDRDAAAPTGGGTTIIERPGAADRGAPAPSQAADPFARLRTARLSLGVAGARVTKRADGRTVLVRALTVGGRARLAVRLVDRDGRPIAGTEVEARGRRGAVVGKGRTGADGRARLMLRPEAGAVLRVGVPAGGALLPARARADVRLRVRPRITLRRQGGAVRTGERVVFTGRIYPAPARLRLTSRKSVTLEWLDPIRRVWRPVVNAPVRRDGTFSIPWRFALRGVPVPMRARVPAEIGWPLMPALSRPLTVVPR